MFVRSKKLMKWVPLSIMKGGTAANMLVKSMQGNLGKKMYTNTLIRNIAQGLYKVEWPGRARCHGCRGMLQATAACWRVFCIGPIDSCDACCAVCPSMCPRGSTLVPPNPSMQDRLEVERQLRNQYPFFKETKEFEYAFKIRYGERSVFTGWVGSSS